MKSDVKQFWNYFQSINSDLLTAHFRGNEELTETIFQALIVEAEKYSPKLHITALLNNSLTQKSKLTFLHRDNQNLRKAIIELLNHSPQLPNWKFVMGIKPYKGSFDELCLKKNKQTPELAISQFLVHIYKLYKTSNKFYLAIYVDTISTGVPKFALRCAVEDLMVSYLGEYAYYANISKIKIVRRKFTRFNFLTMEELKHRIEYKVLN